MAERKDGTRFRANVVITALRDRSGKLVGFAKVTRDLTERKHGEEERLRLVAEQKAREVADAANRSKDEFLAHVIDTDRRVRSKLVDGPRASR